jgi:hypothetical protein
MWLNVIRVSNIQAAIYDDTSSVVVAERVLNPEVMDPWRGCSGSRWCVPSWGSGSTVTVRVKVPQNGRLVRFSKGTNRWCAFSSSICNQTAT